MPQLEFGISSYQRGRGDLPELPVINYTGEKAPTEERGVVLQSRPGLSDRSADMGGATKALFQLDGVNSGSLYGVSSGALYRATTSRGFMSGSGAASIAGLDNGVMATAGDGLYFDDGSSFGSVSFPDGSSVTKVISGASRFIALRKDTQKYYWTSSLGSTFSSLNFASAESIPDRLLDGVFMDDMLVLAGARSIEFQPNTGDSDAPFQPLEGRVLEKGVRVTGCMTKLGSTFACVTHENNVAVYDGAQLTPVSNPGLQKRIEASADVALFTFLLDGVEYLALRLDEETQVYNPQAQLWSEFQSLGETNWIPQCWAGGVFGSSVDGKTLEWGDDHQDLGGELERRFRAGFPLNSGGVVIGNVQLRCNVGQSPFLSGDYTDPRIEMRVSRDAGQTWGSFKATSLGEQGNYRNRVQWRSCGLASQPGFLAEFRVTDPVDVRISDALVNEPYGGR